MQQNESAPVPTLRTLNPYVSSSLQEWGTMQKFTAHLLRQAGPGLQRQPHEAAGLRLHILRKPPNHQNHRLRTNSVHSWRTVGTACLCSGTSSFGMSGVNCHVLVTRGGEDYRVVGEAFVTWSRARLWGLPPANLLISSCRNSHGMVIFSCQLGQAGAAFLWDHRSFTSSSLPCT